MTRHRILNIALTLGLTAAFSAILLSGPALDDRSDEWAQADALADAQKAAQLEARTERSAQRMCQQIKGPNAAHRWTPDGQLICSGNKGQGAVSVAKVAL
jgi:hypothetical protein